jgi:two-component system, OmpR family, phosphate regulon response regulator PhoB
MRILIVEDDPDLSELFKRMLEKDEYQVETASDSAGALAAANTFVPDLVLLDVVLGEDDGRDVLVKLRTRSNVPVIFLSARGLEMDRISGLRMGADDYIVKPVSHGELSARIESVLRRSRVALEDLSRSADAGPRFGELRIDTLARQVKVRDQVVEMTTKEFDLLAFLASSPRQVFSRQQLLHHVWASSSEWQDEATVTEHIRRVRRKIEEDPEHPRWIATVRGIGYRFEPSADGAA